MRTINQQIQDIMLFNYCKIQVDILLTLFIINFDTRKARVLLRFQRVNDNLRSMDQFFASRCKFSILSDNIAIYELAP